MTEVEKAILNAILELENSIRLMPTANPKPNLLPLFDKLDTLTRQLPKNTAPELLHYLHKRSYEKVRLYLEGRDVENVHGHCH